MSWYLQNNQINLAECIRIKYNLESEIIPSNVQTRDQHLNRKSNL